MLIALIIIAVLGIGLILKLAKGVVKLVLIVILLAILAGSYGASDRASSPTAATSL